jgi:hypothetical protein
VAGIALAGVLTVVVLGLAAAEWDPTVFVGFGEDATATTDYGEAILGQVDLRPSQGHDGKYFFVQANDPLLLDPVGNAEILDLPVYRSQRMLYPLLAGGFGLVPGPMVAWSLLAVNLVAVFVGSLATAELSTHLGGSHWWGLAFAANVGLLYAVTSDVSDVLAAALGMWAVLFVHRQRLLPAVVLFAAAGLTREVMLICAVGAALWLWFERRRTAAVAMAVIPTAALGAWTLYVAYRLGADQTSAGAIGLPFAGLVEAFGGWLDEPTVLAAGVCVIVLLLLFTIRWASTRTALGWTFAGFVPLAAVMSERVWREVFDFSRALAPVLTAAVLLIFVETRQVRSNEQVFA